MSWETIPGDESPENPGCEFGLWTNGADLFFFQKRYDDLAFEPIIEGLSDFPGKGEKLEDLDRADRQILRVAELKFRTIRESLRKLSDGERKVTEHEEYQPQVDDDLPRILKKWQEFLQEKTQA